MEFRTVVYSSRLSDLFECGMERRLRCLRDPFLQDIAVCENAACINYVDIAEKDMRDNKNVPHFDTMGLRGKRRETG